MILGGATSRTGKPRKMTFFEKCAKMGNLYYFPSFWATDNLDLMKWTNLREGFIIFSKTVKVTPVSKVTPNNGTPR